MIDDLKQIEETLTGNRAAYGLLVEKHQQRLYASMVHVTSSHTDAEDVVQDAFIQAYVKLDTFQGGSEFYTWLYRIAFNLAMSRRRKSRVHLSVEQSREVTGQELEAPGQSVSERLEREEGAQAVHAALQKLSEEHRAILVLREMEGCDYETIGEILQIAVGTVRSRLHRARLQLRDILKEDVEQSN